MPCVSIATYLHVSDVQLQISVHDKDQVRRLNKIYRIGDLIMIIVIINAVPTLEESLLLAIVNASALTHNNANTTL